MTASLPFLSLKIEPVICSGEICMILLEFVITVFFLAVSMIIDVQKAHHLKQHVFLAWF